MEKKTNGWAIAGIICSIVVGSITGLIFSIIGLITSKKYNSGKGLSIAGIIISVLRILFIIGMIFLFSAIFKTGEFKESFCENVSKESCTKKDDGTYNCIFATCTFEEDDKEEDKEETITIDKDKVVDTILDNKKKEYYILKETTSTQYTTTETYTLVDEKGKELLKFYDLGNVFLCANKFKYNNITIDTSDQPYQIIDNVLYLFDEKEYNTYKIEINNGKLNKTLLAELDIDEKVVCGAGQMPDPKPTKEENKEETKEEPKEETKEVTINNKKHTLTYITDDEGSMYKQITIKFDGKEIITDANDYITYKVIGTANDQYLFIKYYKPWDYNGVIINSDGKELKRVSQFVDLSAEQGNYGCTILFDEEEGSIPKDVIYEKDNKVYYYKYVPNSYNGEDWAIKLELTEITVSNNNISEKTISTKDGIFGQCTF